MESGEMIHQEMETLRMLAKAWNNLDISFIKGKLAHNFVYKSQWLQTPLHGEQAFLVYLELKFQAIKLAMKKKTMIVSAELAFHKAVVTNAIIVLTQISDGRITQVSVLVEMKYDKIQRIDVCFIPDPAEAELTGEFPR